MAPIKEWNVMHKVVQVVSADSAEAAEKAAWAALNTAVRSFADIYEFDGPDVIEVD